ncbi:glycine cleavage system aminomethyltransferase GcvT [uncultured Desulfovibrio sp.]|uniref:glycine cleavage system aminomethyltransferase GcvT n=1 Tax=uncultured Desulfovibrio sp. TaxID=167968 RepID=UPI002603726D|nr:glycine cleavage system aminomethyltransferase GcvT [uncultured Desulfovibrio sp.]
MSELCTPLTAWHEAHGAKMAPFSGWLMPIQYEGILIEHHHTRQHAGLFDICHMGEFRIEGPGADAALSRAVSHNLATLVPGKCRYGFLLNAEGGVLDDCIVYRFGSDAFMIVVNAACAVGDFAALRERLPQSVPLIDLSAATAKIDLQGPESVDVLEALLKENFHDLPYFGFRETSFDGASLLVSRTGYTGELGFELYLPWDRAEGFWTALLRDERVKPVGLGARDTLRLEAGLPLYGHDLDGKHSPVEAGMGRMLTSTADYVGKEGARRVREVLVPLRIEGRRAARHGDALALPGGPEVGRVTSGSFAPSLGCVIAFAWVDTAHAAHEDFLVRTARSDLAARRVDLPFYKEGTARKKLQ